MRTQLRVGLAAAGIVAAALGVVGCADINTDEVVGSAVCIQAHAALGSQQLSADTAKSVAREIAKQSDSNPQVQDLANRVANSTTDGEVRERFRVLVDDYCGK